jgi:membrane-associated phospholipid phosphatase
MDSKNGTSQSIRETHRRRCVRAFLARRITTRDCLGLHLTVGVALGLAAVALFALVAGGLEDTPSPFDAAVAAAFHEHASRTPEGVILFKAITEIGSLRTVAAVALLVALLLVWRRQRFLLFGWLTVLAGAGLLSHLLKDVFQRERPHFPDPVALEQSAGFPSGHALGAFVCYGLIAYFLVLRRPHFGVGAAVVGGLALAVLAVGFSRLYLGVHYFSDILGAYAAGGAWLAGSISALEVVRRSRHPAAGGEPPPDRQGNPRSVYVKDNWNDSAPVLP